MDPDYDLSVLSLFADASRPATRYELFGDRGGPIIGKQNDAIDRLLAAGLLEELDRDMHAARRFRVTGKGLTRLGRVKKPTIPHAVGPARSSNGKRIGKAG
jgi:hypothetical protein